MNVCMAIIGRENWGRLQPLAEAIYEYQHVYMNPSYQNSETCSHYLAKPFELDIICGGSATVERFGNVAKWIEVELPVGVHRLHSELEGDSPVVKARSLGLTTMDYAAALDRLKPDVLLLIGDRYEALGVACAAVTMRIPLVHLQGGEVSGALDERYRHAISKLSDWHVPATERAKQNLIRMGERPESILTVGCPSSDLARHVKIERTQEQPYLLVAYHPNTTHAETAADEMRTVLQACESFDMRVKVFQPNIDFGSGGIAAVIKDYHAFEVIRNLSPLDYASLLANAACAVGNSSSFVRDSGFYGTPVVLVGDRQSMRECSGNVVRTIASAGDIRWCIEGQLKDGRYPPSDLYGDGHVCERIVKALLDLPKYGQKRLAYEELEPVTCSDWTGAE